MSVSLANPVDLSRPDVLHALGPMNLDACQYGIVLMHGVNGELNHFSSSSSNDGIRDFGEAQ